METHGNQEGQIRHNKVKETFIFHMQILQPAVKLDTPPEQTYIAQMSHGKTGLR